MNTENSEWLHTRLINCGCLWGGAGTWGGRAQERQLESHAVLPLRACVVLGDHDAVLNTKFVEVTRLFPLVFFPT